MNQKLSRSEMKMILGGTRQLPCPDDGPSYNRYCCTGYVWITNPDPIGHPEKGPGWNQPVYSCDCYQTAPAGCTLAS